VSEVVELPISGWLSQSEVEANIESASLLLHTAAWEAAVPLVALDAIRLGTPVVMLKRPEYSGILTHGLFETEAEALDLIRGLSSPEAQNALCELQREQIDYYLKENAVGNLRRIYSQGF
jgi:glycosyltransferase involved in cell wall biosynthesis